jgi:integrase
MAEGTTVTSKLTPPEEQRGTAQKFIGANGRPYWKARATLPDGHRPWLEPRFATAERARELADEKTREAFAKNLTVATFRGGQPTADETCDDYFDRLATARSSEGIGGVRKDRYDWGKWISPRIGHRPVAEVTRDEIEDVRNALDAAVKRRLTEGLDVGMSGKTAMNIWSTLRTTFKETTSARDRSLRVRTDDPTAGHKPPLKTPDRAKTFVYPNEFAKLLACEDVPQEWRQTFAIAAYLYVRPEELEALTWKDVDLEARTVSVSKAIDARTGELKAMPKTANAVRTIPIEPALLPLLVALHEGRESDEAPIAPALRERNDKFRAQLFRDALTAAKVTRPRLFMDTLTLRQVDFRSCRDTGITWLALAKVPLPAMQRRAGHEDIGQTNAYVKLGEDLSGGIGEPFPPLPASLLSPPRRRELLPNSCLKTPRTAKKPCRRRESNPRPSAYETPALNRLSYSGLGP